MTSVILCLVLVFNLYQINTEETEHTDVYGRDWVVFIDDKGNPHHINLTVPVTQSRVGPISPVPKSSQPKFWLYTRETIDNPENIVVPVQNKTHYIDNAPLMVLVHGWLCGRDSDSVQFIKNAVLADRVVNVIIMDWSCLQTWNYVTSAENTESAAGKLKDFVQSLANIYHIHGSSIHFVGHSLGAHVVGLAGIKLKDNNNLIISRVTGLDPARPFFELPPVYPGITKDAAAFVDILHTSVGTLGIFNAVGHADFYPGGGLHQPAVCPVSILPGPCEHSSAYIYFQKSFTNKFDALKCQDYFIYKLGLCNQNERQEMGEPCKPSARGSYFLDVDSISK